MPMPVSRIVMTWRFVLNRDRNSQLGVRVDHVVIGQHLELDAVQRIRRVRDQLAQENLAVGVERVRQNIEQLFDLGAIFKRFDWVWLWFLSSSISCAS
jgi:hypothetical protein